jgi:hypothetical protein
MGGRYDGEIRAANPFELVITPPSECRSHAWFGGPVMLGVDGRPEVLAHELGHSVGHLGDEYPYTAEGGSCNPTQANVSDEPVTWACLAENAGGPRCPDGRPVHHHAVSADCTVGTPCARCMMSVAQGDFCPVCYNQLDAAFAARLSGRLSETCNGADDNLDGTVDEGCSCTSCASSCTDRECGQDGCFGDCGTCGAGQVCESNACVDGCDVFCTDALGREICVDDSGPFWCSPGGGGSGLASCACRQNTDGSLSIDSCGACVPMGCASCGASQSCADDSCVDSCPAGTTSCDGICVDTATDNLSCGGCGVVCGAGEGCRGGTCIVSDCAAGESLCGGACVDVLTDDANCGRCGYGCLPWQSCGDGRCTACPDDPDIDICGGYCAIVDSDRGHCGMCDNACGDRAVCDGGVCTCAGADETLCDGACVDVRWNHSHCGACGNACADGEVCSAGACRTCGTGLSFCRLEWEPNYTFCADLLTNADNCGACNSPCADGTCRDGRCESP